MNQRSSVLAMTKISIDDGISQACARPADRRNLGEIIGSGIVDQSIAVDHRAGRVVSGSVYRRHIPVVDPNLLEQLSLVRSEVDDARCTVRTNGEGSFKRLRDL